MRKSMLAVVCLLFVHSCALAFQFEDYEWGMPLERVLEKVRSKVDKLKPKEREITQDGTCVKFKDYVFNRLCWVILEFTPESKCLAKIGIEWGSSRIGDEVRGELIREYRFPNVNDDYLKQYVWGDPHSDEKITLEYPQKTTLLCYYGGEFWRRAQEEIKASRAP